MFGLEVLLLQEIFSLLENLEVPEFPETCYDP